MAEVTLLAVADHGVVRQTTITEAVDEAAAAIDALAVHGIDLAEVTAQLEAEGVVMFQQSWKQLLGTLAAWNASPPARPGRRLGHHHAAISRPPPWR